MIIFFDTEFTTGEAFHDANLISAGFVGIEFKYNIH